jgi:hypothetical protein
MVSGGCLCGAIRFEVARFVGPFELCHCSRCRKASGSAFAAMIGVKAEDFSWISGVEEIRRYEAPVEKYPPGFRTAFCRSCGSPMPSFEADDDWFEIAAGILDDDPGFRPDRHIFVDCGSAWYEIRDDLPQLTERELVRMRIAASKRNVAQTRESC